MDRVEPVKSAFLWLNWLGEPVYRIWWADGSFSYFSNSGDFAKPRRDLKKH